MAQRYRGSVRSRFRRVQLFMTPCTIARQAPLSIGVSKQEYWIGLPCPPPGDLPNPGIKPRYPTLQADSSPSEPPGKPKNTGVGSLTLIQEIFLTQESNRGHLHCRRILYQLGYQGSPVLEAEANSSKKEQACMEQTETLLKSKENSASRSEASCIEANDLTDLKLPASKTAVTVTAPVIKEINYIVHTYACLKRQEMLSDLQKNFSPKCYFKGQAKFGFLREMISVEHVRGPLPPPSHPQPFPQL